MGLELLLQTERPMKWADGVLPVAHSEMQCSSVLGEIRSSMAG